MLNTRGTEEEADRSSWRGVVQRGGRRSGAGGNEHDACCRDNIARAGRGHKRWHDAKDKKGERNYCAKRACGRKWDFFDFILCEHIEKNAHTRYKLKKKR